MSIAIKAGKIQINTTLGPVRRILIDQCNCCCKCPDGVTPKTKYAMMELSGFADFTFTIPGPELRQNNGFVTSWFENFTATTSGFASLNGTYIFQMKGNAGTCDQVPLGIIIGTIAIDGTGTFKAQDNSTLSINRTDFYWGITNEITASCLGYIHGTASTEYSHYILNNSGVGNPFLPGVTFQMGSSVGVMRSSIDYKIIKKNANPWASDIGEASSFGVTVTPRIFPPEIYVGGCLENDAKYTQWLSLWFSKVEFFGIGIRPLITPNFYTRKTVGNPVYRWRMLTETQGNTLMSTEGGDQRIDESGNDRVTE